MTCPQHQLKEGAKLPNKDAPVKIDKSFVKQGKAVRKEALVRNWHNASDDQLKTFFGVSGAEWTPVKWAKLNVRYNY